MTGFEIAALVAMIVGAGMQYKASTDAQRRAREETARALDAQSKLQQEAEQRALKTANTMAAPERAKEQAALEQQITEELQAPVSESQAIRAQQQTTQGNVSDAYTKAKAASDVNALKSAESLARLLGKTSSAGRLRMNEGIRLMDAGMDIDRLNNFSRGRQAADQVAIQQAGMVDPGQVLAGSLLQTAGTAGLLSGGSPAPAGTDYSLASASNAPAGGAANGLYGTQTGSGVGLFAKSGSGEGLRVASSGGSAGFRVPARFF